MNRLVKRVVWTATLTLSAAIFVVQASAQMVGNDDSTFVDGILVTSADVTTCPYRMVEPVTVATLAYAPLGPEEVSRRRTL